MSESEQSPHSEPWFHPREVRVASATFLVLLVVGALLGLVWNLWSRTPTQGLVYTAHAIIPDETEGFISSDGRFLVLTGVVGLLAALIVWFRPGGRGPLVAAALAAGGVAGALATDLVGHVSGGGSDTGAIDTLLPRLPLQVHAHGLLVVEAGLALVVYLICALFASRDDLASTRAAAGSPGGEAGADRADAGAGPAG